MKDLRLNLIITFLFPNKTIAWLYINSIQGNLRVTIPLVQIQDMVCSLK